MMSTRSASTVHDELLVARCQAGDSQAFEQLVKRWNLRLVGLAMQHTGDAEAAQDIAQEGWLAIVRGLSSLRDPGRFRSWAYRIVLNKARDWVRQRQASRRLAREAETADHRPEAAARSDAVGRVREGLDELDPDHRLVLRWYYLEEMSVREIAGVLAIPAGTVKSRLFHARRRLRRRMEEE